MRVSIGMLILAALREHWQGGVEGTSQNSVKANFAEHLFHALG
jgi:hypothetical protein